MKANIIKWLNNRGYTGPSVQRAWTSGAYNWKEDRLLCENNVGTLMHELAHSTGFRTRLNRNLCSAVGCSSIELMIFGFPKAYIKEECTAILSTFLLLIWFRITNRNCYKSALVSQRAYHIKTKELLTWRNICDSIKASKYVICNYFKGGITNDQVA
jgi:hypothetical protein